MRNECKTKLKLPQRFEMTARVYDADGISPTIRVSGDGVSKEIKVAVTNKTVCLNSKVDGKQPSLTDRIYAGGAYQWQ